ncbi:MAG: 6,7-dimethyl-8-ribityllumazine synthase [Candidatus Gracilibacteria bacterium]|nr:6,7-dimethyl-8-ribityllumazine synthase [Candidatus Gracilibacteria bacterium]
MKLKESKTPEINGKKLKIAIILPYFNENLGLELLENTKTELIANNVNPKNIQIFRVAGCLEIPFACQKIIKKHHPNAIIALGIIIRGQTKHFDLVAEQTYQGIMRVQLEKNTPISFGVIACENEKQAIERVKNSKMNKGKEFAKAVLIQTTI